MPKNTRATSAAGKASSSWHSIQDWSDDDSDEDCRMFICPTPLAYALPAMPSSIIPDEEVVDAAPLNQGPPPPPTDVPAGSAELSPSLNQVTQ
jgi:hypothetical protein